MTSIQPDLVIDRYELFQIIGRGGMASVHVARQTGGVGFSRVVAVKRLHPQYATAPEFVAMFLDEARLAARVRHSNVVETLDVVEAGAEILMVMAFVEGCTLAALLKAANRAARRLPIPIVSAIVVGMLRGLHAAHEARGPAGEPLAIIHRDVSPHNVMVGTDGVARVLDFGVAKAEGQIHSTRAGQLRGKLAYMAPEHLRDQATKLSDVYSAGVVLWETIAGQRLFTAGSDGALVAKVLDGKVPALSGFAHGFPDELEALVHRAVAMDPSQRFVSAAAMADALERLVAPARPSEVTAFVERIASSELAGMRALVAAIDAAGARKVSSLSAAGQASNVPPAAGVHAEPPKYLDARRVEAFAPLRHSERSSESTLTGSVEPATQTLTQTASANTRPPQAEANAKIGKAWPRTAPALVLVALLGSISWLSWRALGAGSSPAAPVAPTAASASGAPAATPAVLATEAPVAPQPQPSAQAAASVSASTALPPKVGAAPPKLVASGWGKAVPAVDCNPPFEIDQNGVQRVKVRCYKVKP